MTARAVFIFPKSDVLHFEGHRRGSNPREKLLTGCDWRIALVCTLSQNGYGAKTDALHVSPQEATPARRSIRQKLNLQNTQSRKTEKHKDVLAAGLVADHLLAGPVLSYARPSAYDHVPGPVRLAASVVNAKCTGRRPPLLTSRPPWWHSRCGRSCRSR